MKAKIYSLLTVLLLAFTFSAPVSAAPADNKPLTTFTEEEIAMRMNEMRMAISSSVNVVRGLLSAGADNKPLTTFTEEEIAMRMNEMRQRVNEIKEMDKSDLSRTERKALKKELREMNKEAKAMGQG